MADFHDIRFPIKIGLGARATIERRTEIVTLGSGFEERNSPWAHSRRHWDVGTGVKKIDDLSAIQNFYEARHGALYGFRFLDFVDHKSCSPQNEPLASDQVIGQGDGTTTTFQLVKNYQDSTSTAERKISKPVENSVLIALDGSALVAGTDFTVDHMTGIIDFSTAPGDGVQISAGFSFDTPVRFNIDRLEFQLSDFEAGRLPAIPLIEIRA